MTKKQFFQVCFLYKDLLTGATTEQIHAMKITLFKILNTPQIPIMEINQINSGEWFDILPNLDWVFDIPVLHTNHIPVLKRNVFSKKLYGPIGQLDTSSIEEMAEADDAFIKASNNQDVEMIYRLVAILYRPKRKDLTEFKKSDKWNGDVREPFNEIRCLARIKWLKRNIPFYKIVGIYIFMWSFHANQLIKGFPNLFDSVEKEVKRVGNDYGWAGTILAMSNTKFGDLEKTKNENWFVVLVEMSRQLDLAKA